MGSSRRVSRIMKGFSVVLLGSEFRICRVWGFKVQGFSFGIQGLVWGGEGNPKP